MNIFSADSRLSWNISGANTNILRALSINISTTIHWQNNSLFERLFGWNERKMCLPGWEENKHQRSAYSQTRSTNPQKCSVSNICSAIYGSEWRHLIVVECSSYYHRSWGTLIPHSSLYFTPQPTLSLSWTTKCNKDSHLCTHLYPIHSWQLPTCCTLAFLVAGKHKLSGSPTAQVGWGTWLQIVGLPRPS